MIIKYQMLAQHLQKKKYNIYLLSGKDHYLLNDAARIIKQAWRQQGACDEIGLQLDTPSDWTTLIEEANSYSLFANWVIVDARFDKKSIDAPAKKILQQYIQHINTRSLLLLRAPNVPNKQLQLLANNTHTLLVQAHPFTAHELQSWITTQFKKRHIQYAPEVPALIHQYTQGNMLACAQVIEKIALILPENERLTTSCVLEHLHDQCDYQLYELADACLTKNPEKAIHLLRQARDNKTEPTLILWLLTQEIRQLMQLDCLLKQSITLSAACNQLNIWPQRIQAYERTLARIPRTKLQQLLPLCQAIDEAIKSNQSTCVWHDLETLALKFYSN
jgi:DNA polymerase III subunit delta